MYKKTVLALNAHSGNREQIRRLVNVWSLAYSSQTPYYVALQINLIVML